MYGNTVTALVLGIFPAEYELQSIHEHLAVGAGLLEELQPGGSSTETIPYIGGVLWPHGAEGGLCSRIFAIIARIVAPGHVNADIDVQMLVIGLRTCQSQTLRSVIPWLFTAIGCASQKPHFSLPEIVILLQCFSLLFFHIGESEVLVAMYDKLRPTFVGTSLLADTLVGCVESARLAIECRLMETVLPLGKQREELLELPQMVCFLDGPIMVFVEPDGRMGVAMPHQFWPHFDVLEDEVWIEFIEAPLVGTWASQPVRTPTMGVAFATKLHTLLQAGA